MNTVIAAVLSFLRGFFLPKNNLALENAALRQQLAVFQRQGKRPKLTLTDRAFWMVLRKLWRNWARVLVIVKPETVIGWSRQGFRRTFVKNHAKQIWACDFLTQHTAFFSVVYIFVAMENKTVLPMSSGSVA